MPTATLIDKQGNDITTKMTVNLITITEYVINFHISYVLSLNWHIYDIV